MIDKIKAVAEATVAVLIALSMLFAVLANVLPEGRLKTACSYAAPRLVKAVEVYREYAPKADDKPKDGAS